MNNINLIETEHHIQSTFFRWCDFQKHHAYRMIYAIPNGGHRHKAVALKLKREGVKAGVPDVCMAYPSNGYHGLYIEFKRPKGKTTPSQDAWIVRLNDLRYKTEICHSFEEAIECTEKYLGIRNE